MNTEIKIGMKTFKAVTKAIAHSDNLETMSSHLTQLLVAGLDIKGCAIFVLNPDSQELEILASYGLSVKYLTKGPLSTPRSITETFAGQTVVIPDVSAGSQLQYPQEAEKEGICAIVSLPIVFGDEVIGVLRLYHHEIWQVSEEDLDSLTHLSDNIALAMTYTRLLNGFQAVAEVLEQALPRKFLAEIG
jgi:transcriptional regulator with GAF, ATPase, and Fis domain